MRVCRLVFISLCNIKVCSVLFFCWWTLPTENDSSVLKLKMMHRSFVSIFHACSIYIRCKVFRIYKYICGPIFPSHKLVVQLGYFMWSSQTYSNPHNALIRVPWVFERSYRPSDRCNNRIHHCPYWSPQTIRWFSGWHSWEHWPPDS